MSLNSGHFGSSHHLDRVRFEVCFPTHPSLDDIWVMEVEKAEPNGCKPNGCKPMPMEVCGGYKTHQDDLPGSTTIEKELPVGGWWKSSMSSIYTGALLRQSNNRTYFCKCLSHINTAILKYIINNSSSFSLLYPYLYMRGQLVVTLWGYSNPVVKTCSPILDSGMFSYCF